MLRASVRLLFDAPGKFVVVEHRVRRIVAVRVDAEVELSAPGSRRSAGARCAGTSRPSTGCASPSASSACSRCSSSACCAARGSLFARRVGDRSGSSAGSRPGSANMSAVMLPKKLFGDHCQPPLDLVDHRSTTASSAGRPSRSCGTTSGSPGSGSPGTAARRCSAGPACSGTAASSSCRSGGACRSGCSRCASVGAYWLPVDAAW